MENVNEELTTSTYGNNLLTTKYIGKTHPLFGAVVTTDEKGKVKTTLTKGEAYFLKGTNQWYFRPLKSPTGEFYRVAWYNLDLMVEAGEYFSDAIYTGPNSEINGKRGALHLTKELDWVFKVKDETAEKGIEEYRVKNPDTNFTII